MPSPAPSRSAAHARRARIADAALLAITLVWGITFPLVKAALRDANPLSFCALRLSLAAVLLVLVYRPRWRHIPAATWAAGAWLGFFLASGYGLQTAGLELTSPSAAAFITSIFVILVPLLLAAFWRRRMRPVVWWATLVALGGLYLLIAAPGAAASASRAASWRGDALVGGCALAFALQIVTLGEWSPRMGFRDLAVLQVLFSAIFTWIALPAISAPQWHNTTLLWAALAVTAVLATAVAFTVQSWAQQFTPASHAAVIFAAEPVFAWLASAIGWHEQLHLVQLAGAALIVLAMVAVEWRPGPALSNS